MKNYFHIIFFGLYIISTICKNTTLRTYLYNEALIYSAVGNLLLILSVWQNGFINDKIYFIEAIKGGSIFAIILIIVRAFGDIGFHYINNKHK